MTAKEQALAALNRAEKLANLLYQPTATLPQAADRLNHWLRLRAQLDDARRIIKHQMRSQTRK